MKGGFFNSGKREELLNKYFKNVQHLNVFKLVKNALSLTPLVNSYLTMHSLLFKPEEGRLWISVDNGFAGSGKYEEASMGDFFK